MSFKDLTRPTQFYVIFLYLCGVAVGVLFVQSPVQRAPDISLMLYAIMALITAFPHITVQIPYSKIHISVDTALVFVILMLYGLIPAIIVEAACQFILTVSETPKHNYFKVPFNIASGMVSVFGAYLAFSYLLDPKSASSSAYILPIVGMTLAYYLLNSFTLSIAIATNEKQNLFVFWWRNFLPAGIGYLSAASIATLVLILDFRARALGFVVTVPLLALIIFAQRIYLEKEKAAKKHIEELEKILLTTMQSLALTIDAKDPYTHGHVHRVRHFAVKLAEKLGGFDEERLTGLSFAGLVHDIGKIAIPDSILKKPGKYTQHEFLIMQAHSIIGAEIVKNFPLRFPVSRIVRHHHEKWNGRGYPDALAGEQIPLESRILTVADVWDAICSNRPYRPKMERSKAIEILKEEQGITLDPALTKLFLENLGDFEKDIDMVDSRIMDIVKSTGLAPDLFVDPLPNAEEKRTAKELSLTNDIVQLFARDSHNGNLLKEVSAAISRVVPYLSLVIYFPDQSGKQLGAALVDGLDSNFLVENTVPVGAGVSGWVYQYTTPLMVKPPEIEFKNSDKAPVSFKSSLSIPLPFLGHAIAVVTLYSSKEQGFAQADQDILMKLAPLIGTLIHMHPAAALAPSLFENEGAHHTVQQSLRLVENKP